MHCTLFWVLKVSYSIIAYQVLELKLRKNSNKKTLESDETGIKQHVEQPRRVSQPSASSAMHRALMRGTWHRLDVHPCRPMSTHGSRPSFPLLPLGLLRLQPPDIKKMYEKMSQIVTAYPKKQRAVHSTICMHNRQCMAMYNRSSEVVKLGYVL